ncbi:MAG: GNAT family N-acetyltransferase [Alphaproteobacteria bacterium]|nr:GNAT family N-acetyltransferase [Alphaproteobacteria bacterium]
MGIETLILRTQRLNLFALEERHFEPLAAMHCDPDVMANLGGVWSHEQTRKAFDRYVAAYHRDGISRWAVEDLSGQFLGLAGVLRHADEVPPPGIHVEIGWRFVRSAWGQGFAFEASSAALGHAFQNTNVNDVWAYTTENNLRSKVLMARLGMLRNPERDFQLTSATGRCWELKVWSVQRK